MWVLADDRPGNRSQCLGVAEALGLPFRVVDVTYGPLAVLPDALLWSSLLGVSAETRRQLMPPWPDVAVGAGRRAAPVVRAVRRLSRRRSFAVQLMDPGSHRGAFDLLAVPAHDRLRERRNLLVTAGSPHRVSAAALDAAGAIWAPRLAALPRPRIAVLVGGTTRHAVFTPAMARDLGRTVSALAAAAGGSLMVVTSRRTGAAGDALFAEIGGPHHGFRWGDPADNPYLGYLAVADAVIVTGDSASMCTEACATAAPVYIYAPDGLATDKLRRLHRTLFAAGYARPLSDGLDFWQHPPLRPADVVAAEIRRRRSLPG
ncbi:MAG: nucleoside-diphosphate sugar epimerase [Rhodospirillales bacterium]|nr:MAG: nucleoside-diphosphate sugar epimerase [Rhodospirillales bacterium]